MIARWYSQLKIFLTRINLLPLSISTILLVVNLMVMALPLGSIFFFRLYENQLVRETETELIAQSAFIAEIYKREIHNRLPEDSQANFGLPLEDPHSDTVDSYYTPQKSRLDLTSDAILPPRPEGIAQAMATDDVSNKAGRAIVSVLNGAKRTTLAGMRVLDYSGVAVSGSNELGLSFAHVKEVKSAMHGHYSSVIRQRISNEPLPELTSLSRGTGIRIFTTYPIIENDRLWGVVYLSRTPKSILKYMYDDKVKLIFAAVSILVMTLFIASVTSWTIARPIYRLIDRIRLIAAGDSSVLKQEDVHGTKEIALLSDSFTSMAGALEARSDYIKQFATHVSHEFKTPLTSIKGAAELLDEHMDDMSAPERQRFIHNIITDAERMKQLVNRLLQMARADNPALTTGRTELTELLDQLSSKASRNDLKLSLNTELAVPVWIAISDEAMQMILSNLLDNALQHNATEIDIQLRDLGKTVELTFCDNGDGISPANRNKIFEPFFTTRRDHGGTGLGLGIIKSMLENHRGSIHLDATMKRTCFVIVLPVLEATG